MRTTGVPWYHLNSFFNHKGLENALCDWLLPVYAVTGIPVTVYSAQAFLRHKIQATSALCSCECSHHGFDHRHSSLSGHVARTTPEL
jgi:hypothetical protein